MPLCLARLSSHTHGVADVLESLMAMWYFVHTAPGANVGARLHELEKGLAGAERVCDFVHVVLRRLQLLNRTAQASRRYR